MTVEYLGRPGKPKLAYVYSPPTEEGHAYPLVMFCGGYRSDMTGTKATYFEQQCQARGQGYVRFDYSGHGASEGRFEDGTIGDWASDALAVFDHFAKEPIVLVGSSMGGWIVLLLAQERPELIKGLIGIAAAPDFTEDIYARLTDEQKNNLEAQGYAEVPNDYSDEPYVFTKDFYEEAKNHLLLNKEKSVPFPMRLIQGRQDKDVVWQTATKIQKVFGASETDIIFIEDGGHQLSRPEDLELIDREIWTLSKIP